MQQLQDERRQGKTPLINLNRFQTKIKLEVMSQFLKLFASIVMQ